MYVITDKNSDVISGMGRKLDYLSNGYPRLVEHDIAFPNWMVKVYEGVDVPEYVKVQRHCYTSESGFYENPDWQEESNPYGIPDELYQQIIDEAISKVQQEVTDNGKM